MVFEVTPLLTIKFSSYDFMFIIDGDLSLVNAYLTVIKVETIAPFIAAAALHLVIAVMIAFQRNTASAMVSKAERRVLAQTAIIALYDIGTNLPWVLGVTLPETRLTYFIIEMTWVVSAAINPVVYFVLNPQELLSMFRISRVEISSSTPRSPAAFIRRPSYIPNVKF
ncbi:hypothetical protein AAVH_11428 [Aphelenchoides avenae]|nr:hypothetical protein AAVH_11428 [Aphelenchus avenae]